MQTYILKREESGEIKDTNKLLIEQNALLKKL